MHSGGITGHVRTRMQHCARCVLVGAYLGHLTSEHDGPVLLDHRFDPV
jgi:hypothetical protein